MRTAVTLGFKHGQPDKAVLLLGTDVPIAEHYTRVKAIKANPVSDEFCRVELWTRDGGVWSQVKLDGVPKKPEAPAAPRRK
jgi:hypothetical protein